ncbi:MAG: hypothetical protein RI973_1303 [Bacteroidota bacterium]|jgi:hypothetical protein
MFHSILYQNESLSKRTQMYDSFYYLRKRLCNFF